MDLIISLVQQLFDFFQHIPQYLSWWAEHYGNGLYVILALIIFCETGLVFMPFLPGDSLLFAAGALLALHIEGLDIYLMSLILVGAAILGDLVNYHVGKWMAPMIFRDYNSKILNKKHLDRTREFYDVHGGKTIIIARFMPIIRTYAPFVAGMSGMRYPQFALFNVVGAILWVCSFLWLGYFFGNLPTIKANFQYVILAIIVISVAPLAIEYLKSRQRKSA